MIQSIRVFLAHCAVLGRTDATLVDYRNRLTRFRRFAHAHGVRSPRNLSIDLVRAYHQSLIDRALGLETKIAYMAVVQTYVRWLHDMGHILTDLAGRVEIPRRGKPLPPKPLSIEEVDQLLLLLPPTSTTLLRGRALVELMYGCGLRRKEAIGLNVNDVNFGQRTVFVRGKGAKDRVVPVNDLALETTNRYLRTRGRPAGGDPLFVKHTYGLPTRNRITGPDVESLFRRLNRHFERRVHPHLLRHTFAVHLLQNGADIRHVQELLGHSSAQTTSRYLGLTKEQLKASYDAAVNAALGF